MTKRLISRSHKWRFLWAHAAIVNTKWKCENDDPAFCWLPSAMNSIPGGNRDFYALFTIIEELWWSESQTTTTVVTKTMCLSTQCNIAFCSWTCIAIATLSAYNEAKLQLLHIGIENIIWSEELHFLVSHYNLSSMDMTFSNRYSSPRSTVNWTAAML